MAVENNIDPNSLDNAQNISVDTEGVPIDIVPDKIPVNSMDGLLGRENGMGESYGIGVSNIARPYQSPNFKAGVSGWRLNSNGIIQAVGVEIAGDITISGGDIIAVSSGGTGVGTLTGIVKALGTSAFTAIVPKSGSGSFYVAATSGGLATTKVDWTDGIITAIT